MIKSRERASNITTGNSSAKTTAKNGRVVAIIAAAAAIGSSIGAASFNYIVTERRRTQLNEDSVEIQKATQLVAAAAQKTADQSVQLNAARLEFERQIQLLNSAREDLRVQVARVSGLNDTRRTENDEIRLKTSLAQQANDLVPNVKSECDVEFLSQPRIMITCKFQNLGAYRIGITNLSRSLTDQKSEQPVSGLLANITGEQFNTVIPKTENTLRYWADLVAPKEKLAGTRIRFVFKVETDPAAVKQLKELGGKYINAEDLAKRAQLTMGVSRDFE